MSFRGVTHQLLPRPPFRPQRCHLTPDRAIHLLPVSTPGAPITMATGRTNCNSSLVPLSALRGVISPQTEPSTSSLYPLLGLLLPWQRAELIATLIPTEVQPALLAPHLHPGQEGREAMGVGLGSPCCTAVTLTTLAPRLLPSPIFNSSHHPHFSQG